MKKDFIKYGLWTMILWSVLVVLLAIAGATVNNSSHIPSFVNGMNDIAASLFLVACSLIWFGVGYHFRKGIIGRKEFYKEQAPLLGKKELDKEFKSYYTAKNAKMLAAVFTTAIPWYILGYVPDPLSLKDFIVILPLMLLSLGCSWLYKVKAQSSGRLRP